MVSKVKISVFTTVTDPINRGDCVTEALGSYRAMADEIVVVDGGHPWFNMKPESWTTRVHKTWPREFRWSLIGENFQRGYEACTGDFVIHADLDFIFHENDYAAIRKAFENNPNAPALSFWKYQFILPDRYTLKSRLVIAVNKGKYGDRIKFDLGGDLCQPSLDGKELKPDDVPEARVPFYNFEKVLKTKDQIKDDVGRMARAWQRYFGEYKLGGPDDESAYTEWLKMTVGRFNARQHEMVKLEDQPEVMRETLANLKPDQWGYDGFGSLPRNTYA